jgi:phenylacetate-CoA ligase
MSGAGVIRAALAIARHARADRDTIRAYQDARLRRLVLHAYQRVPFYRRLFQRHGVHPRHVRGVADLPLLPIVSKRDLREWPAEDLVAAGLDPARLIAVRTSGSTGEPFTIRRTWGEQSLHALYRRRTYSAYGVRARDRVATVGLLRPPAPGDRKLAGRGLRALGVNPRLQIDGLQCPEKVVRQLAEFGPDLVSAMPGMLCRAAEHLIATGRADIRPRLVIVGGEVVTPLMRRRLEQAFGVAPLQTYASHEFPLIAWECPQTGRLHGCDDGVIVEVLRQGQAVEPGGQGEAVATNLNAYAMPFIRYRLGDLVTRGEAPCDCGAPYSTLSGVVGRMLDHFSLPGSRVVHPYQILRPLIWDRFGPMRQYQLLQERLDRVVLRLVPEHRLSAEAIAGIRELVEPLLGPGVEFGVSIVDQIPLEGNGKFRPAHSLVASAYDQLVETTDG